DRRRGGNMTGRDFSIREISDRIRINDLLIRYARAIDTKDWDLLDTCFTPDAYLDLTAAGAVKGPYPEMRPWLADTLPSFPSSRPYVTNAVVNLDGDRATVRTYLYNPMIFGNPDGSLHPLAVCAQYVDRLVWTPDGWRIAERIQEGVFLQGGMPPSV